MLQNTNNESTDDYKDRYITYLDLLGFKAKVESAEANPTEHVILRKILGLVRDTLCEAPSVDMRLTYFSDCIIISAERTAQGLWEILQSIDLLTFNLLQYDVFVRGGLTAGGAHHAKNFIYGTAVNRAHMLESKCAKDPITLVSPEVVEDAKLYNEQHMAYLQEDSSQRYFVHYLRRYEEYRLMPIYAGKVVLDDPGRRIIDFVCQRLNKDEGSILAKAQWLQDYWNRTVAVHEVFGPIKGGVEERYISHGPTTIVRRILSSTSV